MPPRKLLVFFFILFTFKFQSSTSDVTATVSLDFPYFSLRNLTLLGDSHLKNGVVGLTRELGVPSSSSGTIIYQNPIRFFDQDSNFTASFSTSFTFSINNVNPSSFGDGFTFFLSPDSQTLGSAGGYLGLVNSTELTKKKFVAIEFDTKLDILFNDPNENHIGLDVNRLESIKTADAMLQNVDLKSGNLINAWIDYKNDLRFLNVFLSYSTLKPQTPLLSVDIDFSGFLKEDMYVGFSGSTEGSTEVPLIESWSFKAYGFVPFRSRSIPHNVSDSSVTVIQDVPTSNSVNKHYKRLGLGFGIAGPAFLFVVLIVIGYVSVKKWKDMTAEKCIRAEILTGQREFSYKELYAGTRGFQSSRIIGRGAFGNVYKANFTSGNIAAVKRSKRSHEGKSEFLAELSIIACLRHKNLVQLQGWCAEKGELLLVYDFMLNGSLDKVLYPETENSIVLTWSHRRNIAIGLASVLLYLHQECEQQVIHRDLKTSNVMLDGNLNPRLGDFGLARLMDHDKSPVSTLTAGTMGYLAPEYLQCGKATEKTDVFSYGVVILEVACGMRPIDKDPNNSQKMVNLVDWVWQLHGEGRITEAADKKLNGDFEEEEMRKLLLVGLSCAHPDSAERPSMRRVFRILNNEADPIPLPKMKPSLTFSCILTVEDIVSDYGDSKKQNIVSDNEESK